MNHSPSLSVLIIIPFINNPLITKHVLTVIQSNLIINVLTIVLIVIQSKAEPVKQNLLSNNNTNSNKCLLISPLVIATTIPLHQTLSTS